MRNAEELEQLRTALHERIVVDLDMSGELDDKMILRVIDRHLIEESERTSLRLDEKIRLRTELFNSLRRLDILTELLEDDTVTEVMINGVSDIYVEKKGRLHRTEKSFASEEKLRAVIQQIVAGCNRRINDADPIVDARLADGSRVNIVLPPASLNGPVVTIRRFPKHMYGMRELSELGSFEPELLNVFRALVQAKYNILISGGTGSGKTTFLNALSGYIPRDERIITIEDSAELKIQGVENLVRLECRNANVSGDREITIRDLIKTSLRMRPDRIVVGEVRDASAIDMLQALNSGHDGSISTAHANSAEDMLSRLETMVLMGMEIPLEAVKKQISQAVDIIIHLGRLRDKSRRVLEISEVKGMENHEIVLNRLFEFTELRESEGRVQGYLRKVNELLHVNKLLYSGNMALYEEGMRGLRKSEA